MHDCNLAAGQNSQAANCRLPCSEILFFFFCSTELLATFPASACSGSPTPHLSSDPFQILSCAVMRAEAPVKQEEVRPVRLEHCSRKMKGVGSVDTPQLLGFIGGADPGSGKTAA